MITEYVKTAAKELASYKTVPKFGFAMPLNESNETRQIDKMGFMDYAGPLTTFGRYQIATGAYTLQYPFARDEGPLSVGLYKDEIVSFCHVGLAYTLKGHRGEGLGSAVFAHWMRAYGPENYSRRVGVQYTESGLKMVLSAHRKMAIGVL